MLCPWQDDSLTFHTNTCLYLVTFHKRTNFDVLKRTKLSRLLDVTRRHRHAHRPVQLLHITPQTPVLNFNVFFCFSETKHTRQARSRCRWSWNRRLTSFTALTGRIWFRIILSYLFFSTEKCYPLLQVIGHVTRCIGLLSTRFLLLFHPLFTHRKHNVIQISVEIAVGPLQAASR